MLVIRLARQGRNKYPVYRIVAAESARPVSGKFVAVLGHYNPHTKELVIKKEDTIKYLSNGAQPSNSVIKLLQREKVELPKWAVLQTKTRAPKKEPEVKEAAPAVAAEEPVQADEAEAAEQPAAVGPVAAEEQEEIVEEAAIKAPEGSAAEEEALAESAEKTEEVAAEAAAEAAKEEASE